MIPTKTGAVPETLRSLDAPSRERACSDQSVPSSGDLGSGDLGSGELGSGGAKPSPLLGRHGAHDAPLASVPSAAGAAAVAPAPRAPFSEGPASSCLSDDAILEYRCGQATPEKLELIDAHLDRCPDCQQLVDLVIREDHDLDASPSQLTTFHEGFLVAERYRVERFLGRGGMGEVYSAFDELTSQRVAFKTVLCTSADDPRAIRKLLGEVLNAQRVAHAHVVKIYDLHEHVDASRGRVPFFTMELIEGESLGRRLRRERVLPLAEVRTIAEQLLAGLAAAHACHVLHLDFKSDNVLLRASARATDAVIMDFGLSRMSDVESRQQTSERLQVAGTMPYMSLEQLECRPDIGPAADVYACGVVLYEMLTGQLPYRGASMGAIIREQVTRSPRPPSRISTLLSREVDAFVLRCLQRQATARYADAGVALAALQDIRSWGHSPRSPRAPLLAALGVLIAVALLAGLAAKPSILHKGAPAARRDAREAAPTVHEAPLGTYAVPAPVPAAPSAAPGVAQAPASRVTPPAAKPRSKAVKGPLPKVERRAPARPAVGPASNDAKSRGAPNASRPRALPPLLPL